MERILMKKLEEGKCLQLIPANVSLAEQAADYYRRNREFLAAFEPARSEEFYSPDYQKELLQTEMQEFRDRTAFHFYLKLADQPEKIIGKISLNNVVWGAFRSAFLGYKSDKELINMGHMSAAVDLLTEYAFHELLLHRIEANVMPRNKASLRVLEKNHFISEGLAKYYLNINGVWEDHLHMVKINYAMHGLPLPT